MIKNLHIQNYRSIRDMSLELEQLNIVFGPNGTGYPIFIKRFT